MELNLNSIQVDDSGRVSFSGLSSGIDFQGVVDSMIAARSIRVDLLQTQVDQNARKIAALGDLKTNLTNLKASLSQLHGAVTFGDSQDIFKAKQAFATASRIDGGTASQAGNLLGVSVTNAADPGNHTLEILRTAKAHKVSSDSVTDQTAALGYADGDTFTLNGETITVNSSTTLLDLRDIINNANSGTNATGVTASIVEVSSNEAFLLLSADDTGTTMTIADTTGTPLQSVGILDGGGAIKNELQAAQTAQFYADGVLDQTNTIYESGLQGAGTVQAGSAGTIQFTEDAGGTGIGSVVYSATDTLADIAANITANVTGVTASVVDDGAGVRLEISGASAFSMAETGGGSALTDLDINNKRRVIERDSNTISDLFGGVTLNLFQAEQGTTINIDIEQDLSQVKSQIVTFIDTFNELRIFVNDQRQLIESETEDEENLTGVLFSSSAIRQIDQTLSQIIGSIVPGLSEDFSALTQSPIDGKVTTGINFISRDDVTDPLLEGTIVIDETKLDEALLNNADEIRKLFTFDFSSSDSRVTLLSFDGNTTYDASGYTLNYDPIAGTANINGLADGSDDGSVTVDGNVITVNTGGAKGLKLFVDGYTATTSVQLDYTVGVGAQLFFDLETLLDQDTGVVETEIDSLTDQNDLNETRIEEMRVRLEIERRDLLERFLRMETALATANRILDSIKQTTDAMFANNN